MNFSHPLKCLSTIQLLRLVTLIVLYINSPIAFSLGDDSASKQILLNGSQSNETEIHNEGNNEVLIETPLQAPLFNSEKVMGVYGTISSVGSDTLATLMSKWAEEFKRRYPHVKFQLQASGSATASQAMTQGTATIGPMSRKLTSAEISGFVRKHGYPPTILKVAIDAIAIYVEKSNPLESLLISEIDAVFSSTRFCRAPYTIKTWHQLGIEQFGVDRNIQLFGRNSASGTYDLFKHLALCDGDYSVNMNELPGSSSVVQSVASSFGGIGYAALGYDSPNVKALSIGNDKNNLVQPTAINITSGHYPLVRHLYLVVNKQPNVPMDKLKHTFLNFILSDAGQNMVAENGYYPITNRTLLQQRKLIQ